jgi:hypothetical protein
MPGSSERRRLPPDPRRTPARRIASSTFGITFNQVLATGGLAVGDNLEILIDVQAIEETAAHSRAITA